MDKGLGVTTTPGYPMYWGDGAGRDSYIIVGNGGLIKPDAYNNTPPRVGYQDPPATQGGLYHGKTKQFVGPSKEATVLKYFGDGSGRDSYVIKDCGGLIPVYTGRSPQASFYTGLRKYNKPTVGGHGSLRNKFYSVEANGRQTLNPHQPWFND